MNDYYFEKDRFVIEDFDIKKIFCSFLPGVAGKHGIPMWSFYMNRGQGISSFGRKDKDSPILEFNSAVAASQYINTNGFRTFFKVGKRLFEPFAAIEDRTGIKRRMTVESAGFSIFERNENGGYEIKVSYCTLPNEEIGGLIRRVEIKNITPNLLELDICDGITMLLPYGITNSDYKNAVNVLRSWTEVNNVDNGILFTKQRSSTEDGCEVTLFEQGNYYLSAAEGKLIRPVADKDLIFGFDKSLRIPAGFIQSGSELKNMKQITANKIPCGFTLFAKKLETGKSVVINTLTGSADKLEILNNKIKDFISDDYFSEKIRQNAELIDALTADIKTKTAFPIFDGYVKNSYLDNALRGGYPVILENGKEGFVYYLYSRKHGDMERDYNWFTIMPEYYSQGNGNFRDVNQNRRNDVLFNPFTGDYNIKLFMSLIQADGYNPHSIRGSSFSLANNEEAVKIAKEYAYGDAGFQHIISKRFTPGNVINYLYLNKCKTAIDYETLLSVVLSKSEQNIESAFSEGYWIDHWTYNLDLIEAYESIFPDKMTELLFGDKDYKYFYSPVYVLPRDEKYMLSDRGKPRQYAALKALKKGAEAEKCDWLKTKDNKIYTTNLISKLFNLSLIKFAGLDSEGCGIEMEADRAGWNDAMNGLPSLFGSGLSETIELIRLINYLDKKINHGFEEGVFLLTEQAALFDQIRSLLISAESDNFVFWNKLSTAKENFRESVRDGYCSGNEHFISGHEVKSVLKLMKDKLNAGLTRVKQNGVYPTYFVREAEKYEIIKGEGNINTISVEKGLPLVRIKKFSSRALPLFLEAPARSFKILNKAESKKQYDSIKKSGLYDNKLGLYQTCESLNEEPFEIGRIQQFTPGHLEREACFIHMTYKYLLGLLKSGLYDEYFSEIRTNLVPFMDPEIYGRSTLENCSFIATSSNPDPAVHGQGFYARLTGANAEVLSMCNIMMFGQSPFSMTQNGLTLKLCPVLSSEFFDVNNEVSCTFLGKIQVIYKNPHRLNTFDPACKTEKVVLYRNGVSTEINGGEIKKEIAEHVRKLEYERIEVYLKKQ